MRKTSPLPIHPILPELCERLATSSKVILQAPPGAGKTTAVPLALMDEAWAEGKRIVILSPRRIAARAAAARMAQILGEKVGERVGYQIRSEKKISSLTKIIVVTEGILTRYLQNNPSLDDVAVIIFDEFHERNLHSDLSLALALQSQECLRDDLKILVMSATLDTRGVGELLDHPPIVSSEGRSYPVTLSYRPPNAPPIDSARIVSETFLTLKTALADDPGDVLVFLSGEREIRELTSLMQAHNEEKRLGLIISPLYGNLSKEEQEKAILPASCRKVVIATNIAETSLTIEGIRIVIDSGFERVMRFDPAGGMERLVTQKISRASADQRAGRAGRTAEGKCYRLWSEHAHHSLPPHRDAEIRLCDLTPLALELSVWGAAADELRWIDPPLPSALAHGSQLLRSLSALDAQGRTTAHAKAMLRLGIHPRLAHMLLRSRDMGYESEAILLCALLSERDILQRHEARNADIRERFWRVRERIEERNRIGNDAVTKVVETAREIASRLGSRLSFSLEDDEILSLLLCFAYPDRIAKTRSSRGRYLTASGKEVTLSTEDDSLASEWLVVARSDGHSTMARIYLCAPLTPERLESFAPELFSTERNVTFNSDTLRVESREIRRLGEIVIESRPLPHPDGEAVKAALMEGIRVSGLEVLPWTPQAKALLERLRALSLHRPDTIATDVSETALLERLESWLMPHLSTETSIRECERLDMYAILSSILSWEQRQILDRLVPSHFTAPTGSNITIDYSDPESPVLAVRIQEMFGLTTHPAVLEGKLPLLVHLLSPARRPIQMTRDLVGFWNGSYADVKKELKGRYPKHFWPDDPHHAAATTKTKKYMDD